MFNIFWLILLFCVINLEYADCYKCEFENDWEDYYCNIKPDSNSIEEKHIDRKTDDNVKRIYFNGTVNGVSHVTQSELSPICRRFENLEYIDVYDVKSVDENLFQQCRNLKIVSIIKSEIEEIPENLFVEQPQLTSINLRVNKLRTLPENVFTNQKELEYLYLNDNQISCLPSNIFKSLKKLRRLDLYRNKIQSLNPKWFETLQSITFLFLSDNKINDLPKDVFAQLGNLEWINLDDNQLTTIHSDSFGIHKYLEYIYLQNNKINAIDENFIDNITVKSSLDMSGNICSNEDIEERDENKVKQKLSTCFKNYRPRQESSKKNHK